MSDSLTRVPNTMTTGLVHQHEKGAPHGVASLDDEGQLVMSQFPNQVTKPVEFTSTVVVQNKNVKAEIHTLRLRGMFV